MSSASAKLTTGTPAERIFRLALPIAIGLFAGASITSADAFFINQIDELNAAAFALTIPMTGLMFVFWVGLGIGAAVLLSHAIGIDDRKAQSINSCVSLLLVLPCYVLVASLFYVLQRPFFELLGGAPDLYQFWSGYLTTFIIGSFSMGLFIVSVALLRSSGRPWMYALVLSLSSLTNIGLDWWMVPKWGIQGAALATVIANFAGFMLVLWLTRHQFRLWSALPQISTGDFKAQLSVSAPASLSVVVTPIGFTVLMNFLTRFGDSFITAFGAFIALERMISNIVLALTSAVVQFAAQNWAANEYDRVRSGARFVVLASAIFSLAVWLLLFLFRDNIPNFFSLSEAGATHFATIVACYGIVLTAGALLNCTVSVLNSTGAARTGSIISVTDQLVCLPIVLFVVLNDGVSVDYALIAVSISRCAACSIGGVILYHHLVKSPQVTTSGA